MEDAVGIEGPSCVDALTTILKSGQICPEHVGDLFPLWGIPTPAGQAKTPIDGIDVKICRLHSVDLDNPVNGDRPLAVWTQRQCRCSKPSSG